jgi:hypothetical protein
MSSTPLAMLLICRDTLLLDKEIKSVLVSFSLLIYIELYLLYTLPLKCEIRYFMKYLVIS